jgi:MerR family transcriptional regulator, heat shock protein HspR
MEVHPDQALYVISIAAELTRLSPQTLRLYEDKGLMAAPVRTEGGTRRYSEADLERVRRIHDLTTDGLTLEGVRRLFVLEDQVAALQDELGRLRDETRRQLEAVHRHYRRDLIPASQAFALPIRLTPMTATTTTVA